MKKVSTIKDRMREALDVKGLRAVDIVERTGIPKSHKASGYIRVYQNVPEIIKFSLEFQCFQKTNSCSC